MDAKDLVHRLTELPEAVQDFVFGEEIGELNNRLIGTHAIPSDKLPELFRLEQELWVGDVPADTLPRQIQERFGFDAQKAQALARDIAGYLLLPLDRFLGDISGFIRLVGGNPSGYPDTRVQVETRTSDEAASEVAAMAGTASTVFDHRLKERLRDIAESFFTGVRDEKGILDILRKPVKTGGLELDDETAARVLEDIKNEARAVTIVETPAAPSLSEKGEEESAPELDAPSAKDEEEIHDIEAGRMTTLGISRSSETDAKIKASVDELYAASGLATPDEKMRDRLKDIINSRLRDVRDQMETLEILIQPRELGGMGLSQDAARALLSAIETKLKDVHQAHAIEAGQAKADWVQSERQASARKIETVRMNDEAETAGLYNSLLSKSRKLKDKPEARAPMPDLSALQTPPPDPSALRAPPLTGEGHDSSTSQAPLIAPGQAPSNLPIAGALVPPKEVPRPVPPRPMPPPTPKPMSPPPMPPRPLPPAAPKPPATIVRPAPPSAARPATPADLSQMKPTMQDVKPSEPRLTGPVEELRATSLVDFRRLSKDPKAAAAAIRAKIDLLSEQSYTKRSEGIKAWMESEVYRTYLGQMREALEGTPMPAVIEQRKKSASPYLSAEESLAVAELSRRLRY